VFGGSVKTGNYLRVEAEQLCRKYCVAKNKRAPQATKTECTMWLSLVRDRLGILQSALCATCRKYVDGLVVMHTHPNTMRGEVRWLRRR